MEEKEIIANAAQGDYKYGFTSDIGEGFARDQMGLSASGEQVHEILDQVKALGISKKGLVTDDEFRRITDTVLR